MLGSLWPARSSSLRIASRSCVAICSRNGTWLRLATHSRIFPQFDGSQSMSDEPPGRTSEFISRETPSLPGVAKNAVRPASRPALRVSGDADLVVLFPEARGACLENLAGTHRVSRAQPLQNFLVLFCRREEIPLLLSGEDKGKERKDQPLERVFEILVPGQFPNRPVEDQVVSVKQRSIQVAGGQFHSAGGFLELFHDRLTHVGNSQLHGQNFQNHPDLVNLPDVLRAQLGNVGPPLVGRLANESLVFELLERLAQGRLSYGEL